MCFWYNYYSNINNYRINKNEEINLFKMKRKYNYKTYSLLKKTGGIIRDKCRPDFGAIFCSVFGIFGKTIAFVFTHVIEKPLHLLSRFAAGCFYDKKRDLPYKGSALYTLFSIVFAFAIAALLKISL